LRLPRLALDVTTLAFFGIAVGFGMLMQNSDLRKTCRSVLQDPEVQKVCREASERVSRSRRIMA
jgi:hypothetical protein